MCPFSRPEYLLNVEGLTIKPTWLHTERDESFLRGSPKLKAAQLVRQLAHCFIITILLRNGPLNEAPEDSHVTVSMIVAAKSVIDNVGK